MLKFEDFNKNKLDEAAQTEWKRENSTSSMQLVYPPKPDSITVQFLDFIFEKPGSTIKEFYQWLDREYKPGNNSQLFAALNQSGIVELVKSKYYIGPNYGKWTQGLLKMNRTPGFREQFRAAHGG